MRPGDYFGPEASPMAHGLDYENALQIRPRRRFGLADFLGTILGTAMHLVFSAVMSKLLFLASGGSTYAGTWDMSVWISYSWTNAAWLPGGMLFAATSGGSGMPSPFIPLAPVLFLLGSVAAGWLLASVVVNRVQHPTNYGRYRWRLWGCLVAWLGWAPLQMTLLYWITVTPRSHR